MPLLYLSVSWLAGTFLGSFAAIPLWLLAVGPGILISAILVHRHRRALIVVGLCCLCLVGSSVRYQASMPAPGPSSLESYNGTGDVRVEGVISDAPETSGFSTDFRLAATEVQIGGSVSKVSGDLRVRMPFFQKFHYGDIVRLTGKLERPPQFEGFDYAGYLANRGIYSIMYYPRATIVSTGQGFPPLQWVFTARDRLGESLSNSLPEPQASLAKAILLGFRGSLPPSLVQAFYSTGTTHLIAISGMNLTIILGMVLSLAVWLFGKKNRGYIFVSLAAIWLYSLLSGLPASMIRAAIMGSMFLFAELLGRQRLSLPAIALAGAVMTAAEPRVLWDIGFQLSFLSMLGLILVAPHVIKFLAPPAYQGTRTQLRAAGRFLVAGFGTTVAAVVATWPVTALNFHSISLVSAPATLFAMPAFPLIVGTSLLTALSGLLWQPAGMVVGWVVWLFLSYFLLIVTVFSSIPLAYLRNLTIEWWQALIYYAVIGLAIVAAQYWKRFRTRATMVEATLNRMLRQLRRALTLPQLRWAALALLIANALIWTAAFSLPDGKLHVSLLDVGQGEAILIRTPSGATMLVDTGPTDTSASTALGKILPFWERQIDMVILTQLQSDHIAGFGKILQKYKVGAIGLPPAMAESGLARDTLARAQGSQAKISTLCGGQELDLGEGTRLDVLGPPQQKYEGTEDDINNNSLVLRLKYGDTSFLLTSDIGAAAERDLLANRADLRSDVLKVAHHGSRNSTSDAFLAVVDPSAAAISCGAVNQFGHPGKEVIDRLTGRVGSRGIFTTPINGTIDFISDGHTLQVQVESPYQ